MSSAMTTQRATLIGLLAPLCWGMGVSLVRGIAEGFGLAQGQTLLYTTAAVCLFFVVRPAAHMCLCGESPLSARTGEGLATRQVGEGNDLDGGSR